MKITTKDLIFPAALIVSALVPFTASADLTVCRDNCQLADIFKLIAKITNFLIAGAGLFAAIRIIISGAQLVTSNGNEKATEEAKNGFTGALWGLVIVFAAYLIINTIFKFFDINIGGNSAFPLNPFN